jgi:hypothetical protein
MNNLKEKKNTLQLPERVQDIIHKLKAAGYNLEFKSDHDSIHVRVWQVIKKKDKDYEECILIFYLMEKKGFDMYDSNYDDLMRLLDSKTQRKIKAVEKYLNGLIEF